MPSTVASILQRLGFPKAGKSFKNVIGINYLNVVHIRFVGVTDQYFGYINYLQREESPG
jgi:hypothetical protein